MDILYLRALAQLDGLQVSDAELTAVARRLMAIRNALAELERASPLSLPGRDFPITYPLRTWKANE